MFYWGERQLVRSAFALPGETPLVSELFLRKNTAV